MTERQSPATTLDIRNGQLFEPLELLRGPTLKNRLVLAPMTTTQSAADGTLLDDEYHWLRMRAEGGFGLVTTCASHVQANGQGFTGQLGCFSNSHLEGLAKLASGLREAGAVSSLQLHHAGFRALASVKDIVGPSDDRKTGARAMSDHEVEVLIEDFVTAALRAQESGFDGVQIHGAHGYAVTQFLSPEINKRTDRWGGSFENRSRLLMAIVDGIREACRHDFQIGVRISPERFGLRLAEMIDLAQMLLRSDQIDYLDLSLWDVTKEAEEEGFRGRALASYFTELERGAVKLGLAGKIMSASDAANCLANGADYAAIGKAGILVHDFPRRVSADATYAVPSLPVTARHLKAEGLGDAFIAYVNGFPGFVSEDNL